MIPQINDTGTFSLIEPYDSLISKRAIYRVVSIEFITKLQTSGIDIYETVYKVVNKSESDMLADIKMNIPIISIQSDNGKVINIPSSAILSQPLIDGHIYRSKVLTIPLGTVKDDIDLTLICSDLKLYIKDSLGIDTKVTVVNTSNAILLNDAEHNTYELKRKLNVKINKSFRLLYLEATSLIVSLKNKIQILEDYIKKHHT